MPSTKKSHPTRLQAFREQMAFAQRVLRSIKAPKGSTKHIVGSLARYSYKLKHGLLAPTEIPKIKDADILVVLPHKRFLGTLAAPAGAKLRSGGARRLALTVAGRKVDVFVALREEKIYALLQYINSKFKNIYLRRRAKALGCKLNQMGLFRGRERLAFKSRTALLKFLGVTKDVAH